MYSYRDGVSEGQFQRVLQLELSAIRDACREMSGPTAPYKPPITFIVVQKRHHVRLFPTRDCDSDDKNRNVKAGTIVDTEITHPSHIDFYLVSHASIQVKQQFKRLERNYLKIKCKLFNFFSVNIKFFVVGHCETYEVPMLVGRLQHDRGSD